MKRILILTWMMVLFTLNVCFAALPDSEFAIGGLTLGSTEEQVQSVYGEPNSRRVSEVGIPGSGQYDVRYTYGDSVTIIFHEGHLTSLIVTRANGWTTPSGIGIGTSLSALLNTYGKPTRTSGKNTLYHYGWHDVSYAGLGFEIKNNKVVELRLIEQID